MTDLIRDLLAEGDRARRLGEDQDALDAFTKAAVSSQEASNQPLLAEALIAIGYIERNRNNVSCALDSYSAAATIYRHLDQPLRLAHTLRHVADIMREDGHKEESNHAYGETLTIYRACDDIPPLDLANALRGFALLKESLGEVGAAKSMWTEAGSLYKTARVEAGVKESERKILLLDT